MFATKPELAAVVRSCLTAGHRPGGVTADEVYGNAPVLREALEAKGVGYVLAVSCSMRVLVGPARLRADVLADRCRRRPGRTARPVTARRGPGSVGGRISTWTSRRRTAGSRHLLAVRWWCASRCEAVPKGFIR
jgi:hypothetical protein